MASTIHMIRPHTLSKAKAFEAALQVAERLKEKAQIDYTVSGDQIDVRRSGAKGRIIVRDAEVEADVELSLPLRPMKSMIESKMREYFDRYLKSLQE